MVLDYSGYVQINENLLHQGRPKVRKDCNLPTSMNWSFGIIGNYVGCRVCNEEKMPKGTAIGNEHELRSPIYSAKWLVKYVPLRESAMVLHYHYRRLN